MTTTDPDALQDLTVEGVRELFAKEPLTLTVERLAELLGQGREATYRQLARKEIPAIRLPNDRYLIYSHTICNWIIQCHNSPGGNNA